MDASLDDCTLALPVVLEKIGSEIRPMGLVSYLACEDSVPK